MIDSINEILERLLSWALFPATFFGAGGAFLNARHKGKSIPQTVTEVMGGAIAANFTLPLVQENCPQSWHWTLFFIVGWGGLELISAVYAAASRRIIAALEKSMTRMVGEDRPKSCEQAPIDETAGGNTPAPHAAGKSAAAPQSKEPETYNQTPWDGVERRKGSNRDA